MKLFDLCFITWIDSTSIPGWVVKEYKDMYLEEIKSIGFYIKSDKKKITIAQSISNTSMGELLSIPICCISKITKLGIHRKLLTKAS